MGRDEVMELLALMRGCGLLEELTENIAPLHTALSDVSRKKSYFMEDACAVVLRQSFLAVHARGLSGSNDGEGDAAEVSGAIAVCVAFVEPLVAALPPREADEDADVRRQRAVLVAMLLSLLGREELKVESHSHHRTVAGGIATLIRRCGMDFHIIAWTLRFREEVELMKLQVLDPDDDGEEHTQEKDDDDDDSDEDDEANIVRHVAEAAGFSITLEYFLKETGQEYAFAAWSALGVVRYVASIVSSASDPEPMQTIGDGVSPYSVLYAVAAAAQGLLQSQQVEIKRLGLEILKWALARCTPNGLHIVTIDAPALTTSVANAESAINKRDWISPLVELTSNATVSLPEASDRALGLSVFRMLLLIVDTTDRFWVIRRLVMRCPYGNVAAVLVDLLRNDVVLAWSSTPCDTIYRSAEVSSLVVDLLQLFTERDLKLHSDLLASVASLIRFLAIRDKENATGLRIELTANRIKELLDRLQSRLRATIAECNPVAHTSGDHFHGDDIRFVLVEAALTSTIELLHR